MDYSPEPWGKRREDGATHQLAHHCADVAACFLRLTREPAFDARLAAAAGQPLDRVTRARLAALAFLHDVGKLNSGFQTKVLDAPLGRPGHLAELLHLLFDLSDDVSSGYKRALGVDALATWGRSVTALLHAALAHHGRPLDPRDPGGDGRPAIWRPIGGYDPLAAARAYGAALRRWIPEAFEEGPDLPEAAAFQHFFAGLVALADQIGSRNEAFVPAFDPDYMATATAFAETQLPRIGFRAAERRAALRQPSIEALFGFDALRELQAVVAAAPLDILLLILEAETGSGKTEAALLRFKALFEAGLVDALYFALPTRAAAVQIHGRVQKAAAALFGKGFEAVLAVPGYFRAGEIDGSPLAGFQVRWDDEKDRGKADDRWAAEAPRRYLSAEISVGTVDQVLLSGLKAKWAHFRSASLSRALLVVDEVHASDAYMTRVLSNVLGTHLERGGHALLMSATLGAEARTRWLGAAGEDQETAARRPYPALWLGGTNGSPVTPIPDSGREKRVAMTLAVEIDSPETVARRALAAVEAGAKVLVLRNTVDQAVATFAALEALAPDVPVLTVNGVRTLHHGRFAAEDRRLLDDAVEAALKPKQSGKPVIVLGTQTLEQSLDIDSDLLITDLCPVDVLLQRIGRLHRHVETPRPAELAQPACLVLAPETLSAEPGAHTRFGLGRSEHGGIYEDIVGLEATRRLVIERPEWRIPAMNRELVEAATHPEVLGALARDLGPAWREALETVMGVTASERQVAKLHLLDRHVDFSDVNALQRVSFPPLDEKVRTRLGADRISIALPEGTRGAFGETVSRIDMPAHFLRGLDPNTFEDPVVADAREGFLLELDRRAFRYNRTGLSIDRLIEQK